MDTIVTAESFQGFATGDIDLREPSYRVPLERSAKALLEAIGPECEVVLLGSVASKKYVEILLDVFGESLLFPRDFVGRGDMSRGGLMLRCVDVGRELSYVPIEGAVRRGARPAKLGARHDFR